MVEQRTRPWKAEAEAVKVERSTVATRWSEVRTLSAAPPYVSTNPVSWHFRIAGQGCCLCERVVQSLEEFSPHHGVLSDPVDEAVLLLGPGRWLPIC